jgi:hypothetical protein
MVPVGMVLMVLMVVAGRLVMMVLLLVERLRGNAARVVNVGKRGLTVIALKVQFAPVFLQVHVVLAAGVTRVSGRRRGGSLQPIF